MLEKQKKTSLYLVSNLYSSGELSKSKKEADVEFVAELTWAPGMVGVMPVFESREAALAYEPDERCIKILEGSLSDEYHERITIYVSDKS